MSTRVVFVTAPPSEAEKLARSLLKEKLCACVNVQSTVQSLYWWEGEIQSDEESLLIIKTTSEIVGDLIEKVKSLHSYEVPEVIALEVKEGNGDYLKWVEDSTQSKG